MIIWIIFLFKELELDDFWLIYAAAVELIVVDSYFIALIISAFVEAYK